MNSYIINDQDLNEIVWEFENTLFANLSRKRVSDGPDDFLPQSIRIILKDHPKLVRYIFNGKKAELAQSSEKILEGTHSFSSGEQVLIKVALDFWDSSGDVLLRDIYQRLPPNLCKKVFNAAIYAESGN
jgi:hypothetical protein